MDLKLPGEVVQFGRAAASALSDPNLDRARRAQGGEKNAVGDVLARLGQVGMGQLVFDGDPDIGLAAGELARQVGRVASPVPIAALLTARALGYEGALHALGSDSQTLVDHARGDDRPLGVTIGGEVRTLNAIEANEPKRLLVPFASVCDVGEATATDARAWPLHEILSAFASLGAVEEAMDLSIAHLRGREQFGRTLGSFQALQHRLADIAVRVAGLRELAWFTMTRWAADAAAALPDALALRLQHLDVVGEVFRNAHQMHGAIGFCDEHPLAVLAKSVRLRQYLPFTVDATALQIVDRLDEIDLPFPLTISSKVAR